MGRWKKIHKYLFPFIESFLLIGRKTYILNQESFIKLCWKMTECENVLKYGK